jgi:hypothetical protein
MRNTSTGPYVAKDKMRPRRSKLGDKGSGEKKEDMS